jgi:hypothetical protein
MATESGGNCGAYLPVTTRQVACDRWPFAAPAVAEGDRKSRPGGPFNRLSERFRPSAVARPPSASRRRASGAVVPHWQSLAPARPPRSESVSQEPGTMMLYVW